MAILIRSLFVVAFFFNFFSCARREQALYQRTQHEQFTQANPSTIIPAAVDPTPVAVNQEVSINEPVELSASATTPVPVSITKSSWTTHPMVAEPVTKVAVFQAESRLKKTQLRKALLKKIMADQPGSTNGLAIAALVCGIVSFFVLGIVLGPLAIIFGGVALSKIRRNPDVKGRGLAVAGLILGIVATVVLIVYFASR